MNEGTLSAPAPELANQSDEQPWSPPKEMMVMCPLMMAAMLVLPILILRRLAKLERMLEARQGEGEATPLIRA